MFDARKMAWDLVHKVQTIRASRKGRRSKVQCPWRPECERRREWDWPWYNFSGHRVSHAFHSAKANIVKAALLQKQ